MVHTSPGSDVFFAARLAETANPLARRARGLQSAEAEALLGALRTVTGIMSGPCSKSHSRAMSAAALAPAGRIGVDVEMIGAAQSAAALSLFLLGGAAASATQEGLYRTWTFREAYFKAYGGFPDSAQRRAIGMGAAKDGETFRLGEIGVMHTRIGEVFILTLVWSGEGVASAIAL